MLGLNTGSYEAEYQDSQYVEQKLWRRSLTGEKASGAATLTAEFSVKNVSLLKEANR